ncbi:hypothetical protein [Alistipes putredinis]|uniref:hypothetical protein n=1 Tax=Alistipes putredinis TaxID=28117 RepID=UPI003A8C32C0
MEISNSEQTVESSARSLKVMGRQYYIDTALAFQYGASLTIVDSQTYRYGYATINPDQQIIKQLAFSSTDNGLIVMKVAKIDNDGYITPLLAGELQSFSDYMNSFLPLGFQMQITSAEPAVLNCTSLYIRYSKEYSLSVITQQIKDVFLSFQADLRGDDPLYVNDIESAIKSAPGVRDAYFNNISVTDSSEEDPITPVNGQITIPAGYFNFARELVEMQSVNPVEPTGKNDIYISAV